MKFIRCCQTCFVSLSHTTLPMLSQSLLTLQAAANWELWAGDVHPKEKSESFFNALLSLCLSCVCIHIGNPDCIFSMETRPAHRHLTPTSALLGPKASINHSLIEFQQTHKTLIGFSYFILQTHVSGEPCKVICSGEPCHLELSRCSGWCLISRNMCCPRFDCHSWPDVREGPYFWIQPRRLLSLINALWFYLHKMAVATALFFYLTCYTSVWNRGKTTVKIFPSKPTNTGKWL